MPDRSGSFRLPAGLLVALALVILLAGFLLGRRATPALPAASPSATAAPATDATTPAHVPEARLEPSPVGGASVPTPSAEPMPASALPAAPPAAAPSTGEVARYFEEADAIEARAKFWSDPHALAKTILDQATSGDTGAFDDLIRAQTGARDELARMSVPTECGEHHRRTLAAMGEGIGLLERVRNAIASGDVSALEGLQEKAGALEREAKAIDALGKTLRQR
jgi:hypothetical protein